MKKLLALTFDDGPSLDSMPEVLDLLERFDARATFYLWGEKITEETLPVLRRAAALGHEFGNHSMHHLMMSRLSPEETDREIETLQERLRELFGAAPATFRPPYLDISPEMQTRIPLPFIIGADIRDWTFETDAAQRLRAAKEAAEDGAIQLMHCFERNRATVEMLQELLPWLEEQDFRCVTVSELFARKGQEPRRGELYSIV